MWSGTGASALIAVAAVFALTFAPGVSSPGAALAQAATETSRIIPENQAEILLSFAPVVRKTAPAVVNVYARRMVRQRRNPLLDDPFFRRFFGHLPDNFQRRREAPSLGSGVIVDPRGLIVTNAHVIADADQITVALHDRREFEAEIIVTDKESDLAVLSVEAAVKASAKAGGGAADDGLPFLAFRDADTLRVGDLVLAIGNPFGVGQTVTSGIVSGLARSRITDTGGPQSFIQTDAAINPGNSGGALVTLDGRLAGINTAIFSRSGGSHGVGFAIPSNLVQAVLQSAVSGGNIVRPWIGVEAQELTADLARSLGMARPTGILVTETHPGGPAERAGLTPGDVITGFAGREIKGLSDFRFRLATSAVGQQVALDVWRKGVGVSLNISMESAPEDPPRNVTALTGLHPLQGAEIANLSPRLVEELNYAGPARGVVILRIKQRSQAARFGARPGDIVTAVNGLRIRLVADLVARLQEDTVDWRIGMRRVNGDAYQIRARRN